MKPIAVVTNPINDAGRIALVKSTAFLVNVARGPMADQAALVAALGAATRAKQ